MNWKIQHEKQSNNVKRLEKYWSTKFSHNKKKDKEHIRCVLSLCSFEDEDEWYINKGWCHHMIGDNEKFEYLKKNKDDKVIIVNSALSKFMVKCRIKLEKYAKAVDALLVQGIKQNIISVGQIDEKDI